MNVLYHTGRHQNRKDKTIETDTERNGGRSTKKIDRFDRLDRLNQADQNTVD